MKKFYIKTITTFIDGINRTDECVVISLDGVVGAYLHQISSTLGEYIRLIDTSRFTSLQVNTQSDYAKRIKNDFATFDCTTISGRYSNSQFNYCMSIVERVKTMLCDTQCELLEIGNQDAITYELSDIEQDVLIDIDEDIYESYVCEQCLIDKNVIERIEQSINRTIDWQNAVIHRKYIQI